MTRSSARRLGASLGGLAAVVALIATGSGSAQAGTVHCTATTGPITAQ